jgi:hypothetical protein
MEEALTADHPFHRNTVLKVEIGLVSATKSVIGSRIAQPGSAGIASRVPQIPQVANDMLVERQKMQYVLNGFSQAQGFRVFTFERVAADRTRTLFTVKTDVALTQHYGIRLQELPLLCRALLEQHDAGDTRRAFTYTEEDMCRHANCASAKAEEARQKRDRRPPPVKAPSVWRFPSR